MNAIPLRFTGDEYLAWEAHQPTKHEFMRGEVFEVFGMVGARDAHVTAAGNLFAALRAHTRDTPCRTYIADMKLRVEAADAYFYPDAFVTCDPRDRFSDTVKFHAVLVVEVLSPATAAFDRGGKFAAYRQLASLKEYALVDTDARTVDLFRREDGRWVLYPYAGDEVAEFTSLALRLPLATVFEDLLPTVTVEPH